MKKFIDGYLRKCLPVLLTLLLILSLASCAAPGKESTPSVPESGQEGEKVSESPSEASGESVPSSETEAEPELYPVDELLNIAGWIGKTTEELGIGREHISMKLHKVPVRGRLLGAETDASLYLTESEDGTMRVSSAILFREDGFDELLEALVRRFGTAKEEEGDSPRFSFTEGEAKIVLYENSGSNFYTLSFGKNEDAAEKEGLPDYQYAGGDPALQAILAYLTALYRQECAVPDTDAVIPAPLILQSAYTAADRILLYGSFWMYNYRLAGDTLYCNGGTLYQGAFSLLQSGSGEWTVESFDRLGDGTQYGTDLGRLTEGNEALYNAFIQAQDGTVHEGSRKLFIGEYAKQVSALIGYYKDVGREKTSVSEGTESVVVSAMPPEPYQDLSDVMISFDPGWEFADFSVIHSGQAKLQRAKANRKNIVVGVNAGHGTAGGASVYTQCHPDGTPKVTGGTTAAGATQAMAVSSGMTFFDGTPERDVNLREAQILRDLLLDAGYDVLMIRDSDDVQLDNVARTVMCNNIANCHIAIHWDGDGLSYDKGCFCMTVPDGLKSMYPVSEIWQEDDRLGLSLVQGLQSVGAPIHGNGTAQLDLTQTSFSKIPSIDVELGNAASDHSDEALFLRARGLLAGINIFFGQ